MKNYTDCCEAILPTIFNCQRVNMMLIDRFQGQLYKYYQLPSRVGMKTYAMNNDSLSGYVAITCNTFFADKLDEESRFSVEIDDPKSIHDSEESAKQIITCPVFARYDKLTSNGEETNPLAEFPRSIIQLINKNDQDGFSSLDLS